MCLSTLICCKSKTVFVLLHPSYLTSSNFQTDDHFLKCHLSHPLCDIELKRIFSGNIFVFPSFCAILGVWSVLDACIQLLSAWTKYRIQSLALHFTASRLILKYNLNQFFIWRKKQPNANTYANKCRIQYEVFHFTESMLILKCNLIQIRIYSYNQICKKIHNLVEIWIQPNIEPHRNAYTINERFQAIAASFTTIRLICFWFWNILFGHEHKNNGNSSITAMLRIWFYGQKGLDTKSRSITLNK